MLITVDNYVYKFFHHVNPQAVVVIDMNLFIKCVKPSYGFCVL